jgi:nitroreductase
MATPWRGLPADGPAVAFGRAFSPIATEAKMNDVLTLLQTRRSVAPRFLGEPGPSPEELETLLTIASRVPDHGRLCPWRFLVIDGEARRRVGAVIAEAFKADNPNATEAQLAQERERLALAPLVIGVVSSAKPHVKIPEWEQALSAGAVAMSLVVAANAMGFGCSWLTGWFAFDRRVLDALGLTPDERMAGFVHIGRPTEAPVERPRPVVADLVTRL